MRRQYYDEHFKIRNYSGKEGAHPFSLVLMSEKEDVYSKGPFHRAAKDFALYKVREFFGLTLLDYLQLTPYQTEIIKNLCVGMVEESNNGIETASSKLAAAQKKLSDAMKSQ